MISLFLGELFRLKLAQRLLLMVIGLSVTLLANVFRTVTLSSIGMTQATFPATAAAKRGVIALTALLVIGAMATAVITA